jgi:PAS domain S-box-containing protein
MATDFATLILNETPDAVIVTTLDGAVVCWSRGAQAVFGYTSEEALGQPLSKLISAGEQGSGDDEREVMRRTLAAGCANYESMRRAKDGSLVYIDSTSKLVHDGHENADYILWSKKDVTPLKVLRDAKLVQAKFGDLLELTPDAIVMANASGRIVLANGQAERLFGYERGELSGKLLESLLPQRFRSAHGNDGGDYVHSLQSRPMGAGPELYGLRKNSEEFPVEISQGPMHTEAGPLVMSAIRDTTERRKIEQALHEKNIELENANQAKDHFLASMSHELRTPLNAIIGFTGTLLMKLPGPLNADQDKQLRTIQTSARHLLSLINDLLDLTKIASGKVDLAIEVLPCEPLLEELLPIFRPLARKKGVELRVDLPAGVEPAGFSIAADRRAAQQIMINLLNNSVKFTDRGEIRISLAAVKEQDKPYVAISVTDTGAGITVASQPRLFQAFTQLDDSAVRQVEGTGLGLHLSQKLAGLMGGRIVCSSEYGHGSVFTLLLPMVAPAQL